MKTRNRKPRRGVLLLVVLSLLVVFLLAGLTFIVVSGQYRRGTIAMTKLERTQTPPRTLMDGAVNQILNPPDVGSALSGHGLLEDLYGRDGFVGEVAAMPLPSPAQPGNFAKISWLVPTPPKLIYYNGCVITMTSGQLAGKSSRIVDYSFTGPSNGKYTVMFTIQPFSGQNPNPGDTFVVNGRPFNGTGSGYMPTKGNLDLKHDYTQDGTGDAELALLPRRVNTIADGNNDGNGLIDRFDTPVNIGGCDEDYDAIDEQNMLLAEIGSTTGTGPNGGQTIIPSMHRPALLFYWHNELIRRGNPDGLLDTNQATLDLFRDICLRPNRFDHPEFSGSNPWLDPTNPAVTNEVYLRRLVHGTEDANLDGIPDDLNGDSSPDLISTWDVDNDGDGVADSIWVDLGVPAQTAPDGRTFKPLFAILCVDLDGRVNLNTSGVWSDFALDTTGTMDQMTAGASFDTADIGPFGPHPYGQGAGPAEIDPLPILRGVGINSNFDSFNDVVSNRYKSFYSNDTLPGLTGQADFTPPSIAYWFDWPQPAQANSAFDVLGVDATAIDHAGRPVSTGVFGTYGQVTHLKDHPYEQNVIDPNGQDSIYSLADLEPMLRPFDFDISKEGSRLATLDAFNIQITNDWLRRTRLVTTQSFDLPVPNVLLPKEIRTDPNNSLGTNVSLADIYYYKSYDSATSTYKLDTLEKLAAVLPFEIWHGEKMNINRWFGDGKDNDNNGICDEPGELNSISDGDLLNDDPVLTPNIGNPQLVSPVRQLFARHLYSLLMFLRNKNVPLVNGQDPNGVLSARVAAQWAINAVDFCDPDSIMTPFEYDANPYNGWNVDGLLGSPDDTSTERGLVWGCERPELLITETLAWHDRRVEDRDDEELNRAGRPPGPNNNNWVPDFMDQPTTSAADVDYDQFAMPVGALFVELYNPNLANGYIQQPQELCDANTGALHVNRLASNGSTISPVWRLVIAEGGPAGSTAGYFSDPDAEPIPAETEKRYVYFVSPQEYLSITPKATGDKEKDFFSNLSTFPVQVQPGQYLVVGSAGVEHPTDTGRYISNIGFDDNLDFPKSTLPLSGSYDNLRRIELVPGATNEYQVRTELNGGQEPAYGDPSSPSEVQQNVAFVVGRSRLGTADPTDPQSLDLESLNVSLPLGGYRKLHTQFTLPPVQTYAKQVEAQGELQNELVFSRVLDFELDRIGDQPNAAGEDRFQLVDDRGRSSSGTKPSYRAVYLQRLANPLRPFDPVLNPYLTVDKATIDLMVFNGLESNNSAMPFYAKQRGDRDHQLQQSGAQTRNILTMEPSTPLVNPDWYPNSGPAASNGPPATQNFDLVLHSTLGYLNDAFQPYFTASYIANNNINISQVYVGTPNTLNGNPQTFPWLAWNNRPFANALELMNVPRTSPATMLEYFGIYPDAPSGLIVEGPHGLPRFPLGPSVQPDPYLMPFLALSNGNNTVSTDDPGLCRLFDYVEVPSRFMGTKTWFEASVQEPDKPAGFRPPQNRLRKFRDPGNVNLNTVNDVSVWNALGASLGLSEPYLEELWLDISTNLRGTVASNLTLDPTKPSITPHPLRSASASDLAPLLGDQTIKGAQVSLLRLQDLIDEYLAANVPASPFRDRSRNPQFHYQELQKLSSMITSHSNVYAVWVTVGYFEVASVAVDTGHPDGLKLGAELAQNGGEVTRHRAFYIIDRSIPVAYEPGKQHNQKDTIVLERFIE